MTKLFSGHFEIKQRRLNFRQQQFLQITEPDKDFPHIFVGNERILQLALLIYFEHTSINYLLFTFQTTKKRSADQEYRLSIRISNIAIPRTFYGGKVQVSQY